jgi:hypothetical protein
MLDYRSHSDTVDPDHPSINPSDSQSDWFKALDTKIKHNDEDTNEQVNIRTEMGSGCNMQKNWKIGYVELQVNYINNAENARLHWFWVRQSFVSY